MRLLFILSTAMGLLTITATAKPGKYLPTDHKTDKDIVYKEVGDKKLLLDVYHPTQTDQKAPVIFYTHGGGWAAGSKSSISSKSKTFIPLLEEGFCIVSISYRLVGKERPVAMRDCVTDCKDALRFIAKNHETYNVDPQRFYVIGDSAGGQIAQIILLSSPESFPGEESLQKESYKMVAGLSWYGPVDFEDTSLFNHDDRPKFRDRFGARIMKETDAEDDKLKLYREMSSINYLKKDSPPLMLIQGDSDTTIPVKHAYRMQEKAKELGANVEFLIVKGAGHNWRKAGEENITPSKKEIFAKTAQFFIDHK